MDLPGEIRNLIYTFILHTHAADKRKSKIRRPVPSGMLLSNHQINWEASSQLWMMCEITVIGRIERLACGSRRGWARPTRRRYVGGMYMHGLLDDGREGDGFAALDERHVAVRGGFDTHTRTYEAVHTERILELLRRHVEDPPLAARLRSAGKRKLPGREILDHKIPSIDGEP
ncbi:hypothetical protein SLS58_004977 [Diplodia intermedia]|uniref:Uncharacterized protein n=1 Tax=Diplodia intermedia TaxID=856260 RepID=A0ABR3TS69_9PEZI